MQVARSSFRTLATALRVTPASDLPLCKPSARTAFSAAVCSPQSFLNEDIVKQRVMDVLKTSEKVDPAKISPSSHFQRDLEMDVLDKEEIIISLEDEFAVDIPDSKACHFTCVNDAVQFITLHPQAK